MDLKKTKWRVGGGVHASTYLGEVEAASAKEAIEEAWKIAFVSVCHQCSSDVSDPEVTSIWVENEDTGEFSESGDDE